MNKTKIADMRRADLSEVAIPQKGEKKKPKMKKELQLQINKHTLTH